MKTKTLKISNPSPNKDFFLSRMLKHRALISLRFGKEINE